MANYNNDLEEGSCGSSPSASCSFYNDDASMMSLEGGAKMNSFSRRSYSSKSGYINPADVASKEQKAVIFSRFVVATVLVIALATVSFTMFWVVGRNERREFEIQVRTQKCRRRGMIAHSVRILTNICRFSLLLLFQKLVLWFKIIAKAPSIAQRLSAQQLLHMQSRRTARGRT